MNNNSKKIVLLFSLFFCTFVKTVAQETKVYELDNHGLPSITPKVIVEDNKIYNVDNSGLRDITPSQIIVDNKVYNTDNGLPDIRPSYIIVTDTTRTWHQERN